jgi:GntR family transcriptional regulator
VSVRATLCFKVPAILAACAGVAGLRVRGIFRRQKGDAVLIGLSGAWWVKPHIAARGNPSVRGTILVEALRTVLLDDRNSMAITRLGGVTSMANAAKTLHVCGHETIVSRYSWKTSMNKSIFRLAPWAGPAYLALADAIELAIQAGSVQAGDRLPPQRILADFLGLHVNTVNRAFRETRQRGLTCGNRRHGTVVLASSL